MKILIDLGNTRIKAGWVLPETGQREPQPLAFGHADLKHLRAWLSDLTSQGARPTAGLGVNVAGLALQHALDEILEQVAGISTDWVASQASAGGVTNAYCVPEQLGADRWVSMIGMAARTNTSTSASPVMLASFGTASTIDTLAPVGNGASERNFDGGLIFPGPALMGSSLAAGTANLPEADGMVTAYPTDTHQAISSGIAAAQAGALLRQWREGLARYGLAPRVYTTGGGWPLVQEEVQRVLQRAQSDLGLTPDAAGFLPAPVLDGLARLALLP